MTQDPDPHEALASIQAARAEIGRDLDYPVWWDFAYGGVLAVIVASLGLPAPWNTTVFIFCMLGVVLMVQWWKKKFGWWVNGYSPRRAGKVAWVTPARASGNRTQGVGVRFPNDEKSRLLKIKIEEILGAHLASDRPTQTI